MMNGLWKGIARSIVLAFMMMIWCGASDDEDNRKKIYADEYLVVPGLGGYGIVLDEPVDEAVRRFGRDSFRISRPQRLGELFKDVFRVAHSSKIYFDALYYHEGKKRSLVSFRDRIVAIVDLSGSGVTTDSVNISRGVIEFILYYGNSELKKIISSTHALYLYPAYGMGVIDDDQDDDIDAMLLFIPSGRKRDGR